MLTCSRIPAFLMWVTYICERYATSLPRGATSLRLRSVPAGRSMLLSATVDCLRMRHCGGQDREETAHGQDRDSGRDLNSWGFVVLSPIMGMPHFSFEILPPINGCSARPRLQSLPTRNVICDLGNQWHGAQVHPALTFVGLLLCVPVSRLPAAHGPRSFISGTLLAASGEMRPITGTERRRVRTAWEPRGL